jgi:uncharacterized protein
MKTPSNPFQVKGYHGKELFCDREKESKYLISNALNGINTTLLSVRRMGKTGLILNTFEELKQQKQFACIYIDIYATQNLKEFTDQLAFSVLQTFPEKQSIGSKFMTLLKSLKPIISFDPLNGLPNISFEYVQPKQYEYSLKSIFNFISQINKDVLIAIDEFQQISTYPEKNTEAFLRTIVQQLKNVNFIFSGSSKHMLTQIFSDSKRPFFSSTQILQLKEIDREVYGKFIRHQFEKNKRKIDEEALQFILDWTRVHTYYTQSVCNRLFARQIKHITLETTKQECSTLLKEHEAVYFQYRNLLTSKQWSVLKAIAKEDKVYHPSSQDFLGKHNLGSSAAVLRALQSLSQSEMIFKEADEQGEFYRVYDCFLARWLEIYG